MTVRAAETVAPARVEPGVFARVLVVVALVGVAYHRTALELWTTWRTNDNYSHGPLVPLVALALIWLRRRRLAEVAPAPDARGLGLVAFACLLQIAGVRADLFALQGWSFIVLLFGLSLTFLGRTLTRRLAFPIAYLAFMLTFPPFVMNQLSYALKEIAVRLASFGAEALGVTHQRWGMTIYLASGVLRIENPCSGLRSLLALFATGALFAYVQPGGGWRRAAMLLASIPIAVLGNVVRLLLLIVVGHYRSVAFATGAFHDLTGYVLYAVALAAMLVTRRVLSPPRTASPGPLRPLRGGPA